MTTDWDPVSGDLKPSVTISWWHCSRCTEPITGEDPHTDPHTGDDVHEACCAACHPELAEVYGITLQVTTDDLRQARDLGPYVMRDEEGRPLVAGHGVPTQDQTARAERRTR